MKRNRLNKIEAGIGWFVTIMFASIVIGFQIIALITKIITR